MLRVMNEKIFWLKDAPPSSTPLAGDTSAEVAIVGGGFTGLSTALHLKRLQPAADIIVLDAGIAGGGSSGRNLGLTPTPIGNRILETLAAHGPETTAGLHRAGLHGIDLIEGLCTDHDIDCDFNRAGSLLVATDRAQADLLARQAAAYDQIGIETALLDGAETAACFGAIETTAGLRLPFNRDLHPGKLVLGMKRAALEAGVRIHDGTPCLAIEAGAAVTLTTPKGQVRADAVALACGGYTGPVKALTRQYRPTYSYVLASEPLSNKQWDSLAWPARENIYSTHTQFWCLRSGRDGRLFVVNGTNAHCPWDRERDASWRETVFRTTKSWFQEKFPALADLEFSRAWGGRISLTMDGLPTIGRLAEAENVHYAFGYSGRGVLMSQVAGQAMAERIAGAELSLPDNPILDRPLKDFPPNPAAWLGINLTFAKLRRERRGA